MSIQQKPLPQHLQDFLDWLDVEKGLASKSQENYARFLAKFFHWLEDNRLERLKPSDFTSDHVWRYRLFLSRRESLKKSTQNYYLIALRSFLSYFAEKNITSLPPEKIKLVREKDDREVRFLTRDQLLKFFEGPRISTLQGLRDRAILEALFSTGLRISELVNLDRKQIRIPKNLKEEVEVVVKGKGGRVRTVYFSSRSLEWLKRYLEARNDMHPALFVSSRGKGEARRIPPRTIQAMFKRYAAKAGIPYHTTPHVMRHSFATDLLSKGVDIRMVQEFLGHKNIAATQIYAHVTSKRLKDIHKKVHGDEGFYDEAK